MKRSLFALMQSGQGEQKTRRGVNKETDASRAVTGSSAVKAAARFYPTITMAVLMGFGFTHCPQSHFQKLSLLFSGGYTRFQN